MTDRLTGSPVLSARDLRVSYGAPGHAVPAVDGVDFEIMAGETLGLVGESGCGKSSVARAILGLVDSQGGLASGQVDLEGVDLLSLSSRQLRAVTGARVAMVFQDPGRSLNPAFTVGEQIAETLRLHTEHSRREAWTRAVEVMTDVGLADAPRTARQYPHQLSGGMCQRVLIAMAIACRPQVLIADEPTTGLDPTVQSQILRLLRQLQHQYGLAILFITHDLGVVAEMSDRVAVMYAGRIVETGDAVEVFERPQHPYTAGLLASVPDPLRAGRELASIKGQVPRADQWPEGCRFAPRCPHMRQACTAQNPELRLTGGHAVRCIRADELCLKGVADAEHA